MFSFAGSTGHGKALKDPAADIIRTRLGEYAEAGILTAELEKTYNLLEKYTTALTGLQELRKEITKGSALFDRYIFAAEALKNRAEFGILAASEYLQKPHPIDRNAIKEIGGNSDTVCVQDKAVQSLCDGWNHNGLGWITETFPSKIKGCTNVTLYYGSSTYDTAQMSRLVNMIVQECEQLGIETKSQEEIDSLLNSWRNAK